MSIVFGVVFAMNSALHSFLVLAFSGGVFATMVGLLVEHGESIFGRDPGETTGAILLGGVDIRDLDRTALRARFGVWRSSLGAGFLGAFASQFWFIGFSLTSAANVRTVALVEVIFAAAVSRYVFRQAVSARQMIGMAVICAGVGWLLRLHG